MSSRPPRGRSAPAPPTAAAAVWGSLSAAIAASAPSASTTATRAPVAAIAVARLTATMPPLRPSVTTTRPGPARISTLAASIR